MSRSYKKAIIKDKPRNHKRTSLYWRRVRRNYALTVRRISKGEEIDFASPKTIVNDYDYCDYIVDFEFTPWRRRREFQEEERKINRRK